MGNVSTTGLTFNKWSCLAEGGPNNVKFVCNPGLNSLTSQFSYACDQNLLCQPANLHKENTPTVQCRTSYARGIVCQPVTSGNTPTFAPLTPARPQAPRSTSFPLLDLHRPVTPDLVKAQSVLEKTDWRIASTTDQLWLFQLAGFVLFFSLLFFVIISIADESD
jgi:hypothetical protein